MDLREFMANENLSIRKFCLKSDISLRTVYNIFGGKNVRREVADKVFRITRGKVKLKIETKRNRKKDLEIYNNILDYRG